MYMHIYIHKHRDLGQLCRSPLSWLIQHAFRKNTYRSYVRLSCFITAARQVWSRVSPQFVEFAMDFSPCS